MRYHLAYQTHEGCLSCGNLHNRASELADAESATEITVTMTADGQRHTVTLYDHLPVEPKPLVPPVISFKPPEPVVKVSKPKPSKAQVKVPRPSGKIDTHEERRPLRPEPETPLIDLAMHLDSFDTKPLRELRRHLLKDHRSDMHIVMDPLHSPARIKLMHKDAHDPDRKKASNPS